MSAKIQPAKSEFLRCKKCGAVISIPELEGNLYVCPRCGNYYEMDSLTRIDMIADPGSFEERYLNIPFDNVCEYPGYEEKHRQEQAKSGASEAVRAGRATIGGIPIMLGVMEPRFMMGSMGRIVGERITLMMEDAVREKRPVILYTASGGARMQEGIISLMQMAKTAGATVKLDEAKIPYIVVLTSPTTGGVSASFAMLGDVILSEPGALVCFAGPRLVYQTIKQELPEGFQLAEDVLKHGFIDAIVERKDQKNMLIKLLNFYGYENNDAGKQADEDESGKDTDQDADRGAFHGVRSGHMPLPNEWMEQRDRWEIVKLARDPNRLRGSDFINNVFHGFIELHGDRAYGDDHALRCGFAYLDKRPVMLIVQDRGRGYEEEKAHNFGMPEPEGYRKVLRQIKHAEKFGLPVICLIDTPGAYAGIGAEYRGQASAIAFCLKELATLRSPVVSVILGEGGSGGALALGAAGTVYMFENAVYSILSPESFANILFKDTTKKVEAARTMKITARDLYSLGVIDGIIPEAPEGNWTHPEESYQAVKDVLNKELDTLSSIDPEKLVKYRQARYRLYN